MEKVLMNKETGELYLVTRNIGFFEIFFVVLFSGKGYWIDWNDEEFIDLGDL